MRQTTEDTEDYWLTSGGRHRRPVKCGAFSVLNATADDPLFQRHDTVLDVRVVNLIDHVAEINAGSRLMRERLLISARLLRLRPCLSSTSALHMVPKTGDSLSCHPSFLCL